MSDPIASTGAASATGATTAKPTAKTEQDKLKSAAKAFEAIFLRQMIGSMRSASLADGITDSDETQQFRDMSDSKMADNMAAKGTLHIADMLVKQYGARISGGAAATTAAAPSAAGATGGGK